MKLFSLIIGRLLCRVAIMSGARVPPLPMSRSIVPERGVRIFVTALWGRSLLGTIFNSIGSADDNSSLFHITWKTQRRPQQNHDMVGTLQIVAIRVPCLGSRHYEELDDPKARVVRDERG